MKIIPLILLALAPASVSSQWSWTNPTPTGQSLFDVSFIDSHNGVIVGENGAIFRTSDLGVNWVEYRGNPDIDYDGICSTGPDDVWIWGTDVAGGINSGIRIRYTADQGRSWEERFSGAGLPETLRGGFNDIEFLNAVEGYSVGDSGLILKTTDAGHSWSFDRKLSSDHFQEIGFLGDGTGLISGGNPIDYSLQPLPKYTSLSHGSIWRSPDTGMTWNLIYSDTISIYDHYFRDSVTGWALGSTVSVDTFDETFSRYYLLNTTDGGFSWNRIATDRMEDITFVGESAGFAVGPWGEVLSTTDAGVQWEYSNPITRFVPRLYGVGFADPSHGCIVGADGAILQTSDGGATWSHQDTKSSEAFITDVFFIRRDIGLYIDGDAWKTTDAGESWQNSGMTGIRSIHCPDDAHCWICGDGGTIRFSSNAGDSWIDQISGMTGDLRTIQMVDSAVGWAGGGGSSVLNTTNGGETWISQLTPGIGGIMWMVFQDRSRGWIYGTVNNLCTTNGGLTWASILPSQIYGLYFLNSDTGWGRRADTLFRTTDSGVNWEPVSKSTVFPVQFTDDDHGWNRTNTRVSSSTDGGVTWKSDFGCSSYRSLTAMHFVDSTHGWLVGTDGALVRYGYPEKIVSVDPDLPYDLPRSGFRLFQNYPNPFNPATTIGYELYRSSRVTVRIFDLHGRVLRTLVEQDQSPGRHFVSWDGTDMKANPVSTGVYFYQLRTEFHSENRKLMVLH